MSHDIDLHGKACEHCNRAGEHYGEWNFTYNLSPMFREAGIYDALYPGSGTRVGAVLDALEKGIADMGARPEHYRTFDAPNGWGTYDQTMPRLNELLDVYRKHSNAEITHD